jgi:tRNA A37 threonylcarbamoyltransferase TsaD
LKLQALKGNENAVSFPQAFRKSNEIEFSFSGLKTALRYYLEKIERMGQKFYFRTLLQVISGQLWRF